MKYLFIKDVRVAHAAIRTATNKVSRETHRARQQIAKLKADLEKTFEGTGMSKFEIKNQVAAALKRQAKPITQAAQAKNRPELQAIEKHRQTLEAAREMIGNPIRRINAITAMDKTLAPQRAAVAQLLINAGPAELETIALAAKSTGDLATLAACISKNSTLNTNDRRMLNAEMLEGVVLPDQLEIEAVLHETVTLPAYVMACDRSLNKMGVESGTDKIERGLHDRQVELQADGALTPFEFEHKKVEADPDYKRLEPDNDKPKPKVEDLKPEDFDSPAAFMLAGGSGAVVEDRCAELWPAYLNNPATERHF